MRHNLKWFLRTTVSGKPAVTLYARPSGSHAHVSKECPLLKGKQFKAMGYGKISPDKAKARDLSPCACLYEFRGNRKEGIQ